jgi:glutamate N-acetyltransferase / amino-acid N-acetyltransferase
MPSNHEHHLIDFPSLHFPSHLQERSEEVLENRVVGGFLFSGEYAGLKKDPTSLDFGLVHCPHGATCAGVFTQNQVVAAPVVLSRQHLDASTKVNAIVVNSGNANACTGTEGTQRANILVNTVATLLSEETSSIAPETIQIASTGVIGAPLPINRLLASLPKLQASLSAHHIDRFATAIMTTDNRPKYRTLKLNLEGVQGAGDTQSLIISGCSKGAGMIHPNMATMLAYLFTDAPIESQDLQALWGEVCQHSFNAISIDGDTSTNDTALILSSGDAGSSFLKGAALRLFKEAAQILASALAIDILRDGEGVEHVAHIHILGARTKNEARQIAEVIALSPLVKTAMNGCDPNWGRIIAAIGRSGVNVDPDLIDLSIGEGLIYNHGVWGGIDAERIAHQAMKTTEYSISIRLNLGQEQFTLYTTDLSAQYVRINADYRS